jgi:hypothetical protein
LAISNFSAFPAVGAGTLDVPGAAMSFTLFFELNMLSICSSIYNKEKSGKVSKNWIRNTYIHKN